MSKLDRIIHNLKNIIEDVGGGGMTTGSGMVGGKYVAGFSSDSPAPTAGISKKLGKMTRRTSPPEIIGKGTFPGARTRWRKGLP